LMEWRLKNEWLLTKPEIILFVRGSADHQRRRDYVLIQRGDHWVRRLVWHVTWAPTLAETDGLYAGRVVEDEDDVSVLLQRRVDDDNFIVRINFSEPSRRFPGTFVGGHQGKVVLPLEHLQKPGIYRALLLNSEGSYYRALVL